MKSCCRKSSGSFSPSEHSQYAEESSLEATEDDSQDEYALGAEMRKDCDRIMDFRASEVPYLWYPSLNNVKQIDYVRRLECDFEALQTAFFSLTTHFARLQFRLRQIMTAPPCERDDLFCDLEKIAFGSLDDCEVNDEMPHMQHDHRAMGDVRRKQAMICEQLRSQLTALSEASEIEGMEIIDAGKVVWDEDCGKADPAAEAAGETTNESDFDDTNYGRQPLGTPAPVSNARNKAGKGGGGAYVSDSDNTDDKNYGRRPMDTPDNAQPKKINKTTFTGGSLVENTEIGDSDEDRLKLRKKRH